MNASKPPAFLRLACAALLVAACHRASDATPPAADAAPAASAADSANSANPANPVNPTNPANPANPASTAGAAAEAGDAATTAANGLLPLTVRRPPLPASDPVDVRSMTADGEVLAITVAYRGGCSPHAFALVWDGTVIHTGIGDVDLHLLHDAHGDACRKEIVETLRFDASSLPPATRTRVNLGTLHAEVRRWAPVR